MKTPTDMDDGTECEVIIPGKLTSIIRSFVMGDNALQSSEFDPTEQADRISTEHAEEIQNHPEFHAVACRKLVRQVSGQIARSGIALLMESVNAESGQFQLIIQEGQTIKISDDLYVPAAFATPEHLSKCAKRIAESAEMALLQSHSLARLFNAIRQQMMAKNVSHLGELANDGIIEFPYQY